ncbi:putative CYC2-like cyclin 6 [Trypanosoma rangeli]|uniref:Putative CYC2-like cyclin 6 n=1 Tax=Trypanosoma rangeli TaxID=5698 RepID=A0A422NWY4_TRYRA|nr:putative CYC2-like cyclin 6 [Trypanosoma rangeli]RNF10043.1 putative CYC2-like cyclin 6 [Trypanosoma rangeli]|eukprot:RNF10043.1 putative CYC2-like cyclin 6 [Trypanosoma rangeli]
MTALSLVLPTLDQTAVRFGCMHSCSVDDVEAAVQNAHTCRMFLLAMEVLLQKQWRHYQSHDSGMFATPQRMKEGELFQYFPFPCVSMRGRGSCFQKQRRTLSGSSAAGKLRDFIYRLICYARCSIECYPITLALVDRFYVSLRKESVATEYEAAVDHLPYVFAVLLLITAKYRDDKFRSNRYFSQLAGLSLVEWNALERLAIRVLKFSVNVSFFEYIAYEKLLLAEMTRQEGRVNALTSLDRDPRSEEVISLLRLDNKSDVFMACADQAAATNRENPSANSCGLTATTPSLRSQGPLASALSSPVC